jgi:hypothetical protein
MKAVLSLATRIYVCGSMLWEYVCGNMYVGMRYPSTERLVPLTTKGETAPFISFVLVPLRIND